MRFWRIEKCQTYLGYFKKTSQENIGQQVSDLSGVRDGGGNIGNSLKVGSERSPRKVQCD